MKMHKVSTLSKYIYPTQVLFVLTFGHNEYCLAFDCIELRLYLPDKHKIYIKAQIEEMGTVVCGIANN